MNTPPIETDRLILRRFTKLDIPALFRLLSDRDVNTFLPWFPLETMEEAESFYRQRFEKSYSRPHGYNYAVCLKSDNIPIGYVNVGMEEAHDLGYGLSREFWHNGIMTEACWAVIDLLRMDGFPFITATHDINNPRSGGVMRNIGMKYMYTYQERVQPKDTLVFFRMYQLDLDGRHSGPYMGYWNTFHNHFIEADL